jgi:replication factor C subunit 1
MNIVLSGNFKHPYEDSIDADEYCLRSVVRADATLLVGSECNDGRPITESYRYKRALALGIPIIRTNDTNKKKKPPIGKGVLKETGGLKEPLVNKYSPKTVADIIGHKEQITTITNWLYSWATSKPEQRAILISGPPGIGKTTTIHLIAKSLGYAVSEYNASDTRSASVLKGMFALGIKRLKKEIIVMDEIDGLSDRGGVGEIAAIIRKTTTPIICITNEKPPKLRPIINVCLDVRFSRPNKSTIAGTIFKIAQKESIQISKADLETLCEQNGNDIRGILNALDFYKSDCSNLSGNDGKKDSILRMDPFSATQKLIGNKGLSLDDAANLVFVDYGLIPLMVGEAYINASKGSLEDVVKAAEYLTNGDIMDRKLHQKQDWSLLPHYVNSIVSVAKTVSGPAPFQIFPQWLGKNSKRVKHKKWLDDMSQRCNVSGGVNKFRLDIMDPLYHILLDKPDIKGLIGTLDELHLTRDDIMEYIPEITLEKIEIATKVKSAFTREYNKVHSDSKAVKATKKKTDKLSIEEDDAEINESEEELDNEDDPTLDMY